VTLTLAPGNSKQIMKTLLGLAKLLKMDPPKQWLQKDKVSIKEMLRTREDTGRESEFMELALVIAYDLKPCRECDLVIRTSSYTSVRAASLGFLSKRVKLFSTI